MNHERCLLEGCRIPPKKTEDDQSKPVRQVTSWRGNVAMQRKQQENKCEQNVREG